jgi:phosphoribosylanthranilate isomerase
VTKLKLCGLTRWEDISFAAEQGVDYLGLILSSESKRQVSLSKAAEFVQKTRSTYPNAQMVAVITTENLDEIKLLLETVQPDYLQVHNDCDAQFFNAIPFENKIKVFRMKSFLSVEVIESFRSEFYLFDTYSKSAKGGTGKLFNWNWVPSEVMPKSFMSGGLTPQKVTELITVCHPYGVDLNSGCEHLPGIKDHHLIEEAVRTLKTPL